MPDENFLQEVVARWRQQTFNPGAADYTLDTSGTLDAAQPGARRQQQAYTPQPGQRPLAHPGSEGLPSRTAQPAGNQMAGKFPPPPPQPQPQSPQQAKESLASLLKQFRS
jgi:hypothetical protein